MYDRDRAHHFVEHILELQGFLQENQMELDQIALPDGREALLSLPDAGRFLSTHEIDRKSVV